MYENGNETAEIHSFSDDKHRVEEFKKTLLCFPTKLQEEPNLLFSSVIYGIYYLQTNEKPADFLTTISAINPDKFSELAKIKDSIMLDYTLFGHMDKCILLNDILARHFWCFLRFYERRNKYRYQLRKKLQSKN